MGLLLDNIIDNAVRYSGDVRWLRVQAEKGHRVITITIADKGIGIPPDELPHVARKFFRGRRSGSGGSGLGLAIVDRIINAHGGSFVIDSSEGAGTSVRLILPVAEEEDEATYSGDRG
jgi:signal transduction histidine kinase